MNLAKRPAWTFNLLARLLRGFLISKLRPVSHSCPVNIEEAEICLVSFCFPSLVTGQRVGGATLRCPQPFKTGGAEQLSQWAVYGALTSESCSQPFFVFVFIFLHEMVHVIVKCAWFLFLLAPGVVANVKRYE